MSMCAHPEALQNLVQFKEVSTELDFTGVGMKGDGTVRVSFPDTIHW